MVKITKLSTKEEVWQEVLDRTYSGNGDFTRSEQKIIYNHFWVNHKLNEEITRRTKKIDYKRSKIVAKKGSKSLVFNALLDCAMYFKASEETIRRAIKKPTKRGKVAGWKFEVKKRGGSS